MSILEELREVRVELYPPLIFMVTNIDLAISYWKIKSKLFFFAGRSATLEILRNYSSEIEIFAFR